MIELVEIVITRLIQRRVSILMTYKAGKFKYSFIELKDHFDINLL